VPDAIRAGDNHLSDNPNPPATRADIQHLENLIIDLTNSLSDHMDAIQSRLDRQGGWLRSGQTNLVRMNNWSEDIDALLAKRDKRLDTLEARLRKLEP
jgi:hypothetical protein